MKVKQSLLTTPPRYRLLAQDVDWYLVDIENQNYIDLNSAIHTLSSDEEKRRKSFHKDKLKSSFAIRRGLLRLLLANQTGTNSKEIYINYNKYGKPFVNQDPVYFNLSYSEKLTIYAFSISQDLGVDIEKVTRIPDECNIALYIMTEYEYSLYQCLSSEKATAFFFKCWTAKEAYLKLLGVGLNIEPKDVILEINHNVLEPCKAQTNNYPLAQFTYIHTDSLISYITCIATYVKQI